MPTVRLARARSLPALALPALSASPRLVGLLSPLRVSLCYRITSDSGLARMHSEPRAPFFFITFIILDYYLFIKIYFVCG